jgi:hypothetical protein
VPPYLVVRGLEVAVARICTADLATVQPGTATNSLAGQFAPGLDDLPNPAVAIGAVQPAPPPCGLCFRPLSLCSGHGPQPSSRLVQAGWAALGEQFERARVEPSVALAVDPVEPGLPRSDLIARAPEPDVGSELGRCADGGVEALAQPVLLDQRRLEPLTCAVAFLACDGSRPFSPSVGGRAKGRERVRPNERSSLGTRLLR